MKDEQEFRKALMGKNVPILVLDQKWHRLFAIQGKPDEVHKLEEQLNSSLARQGKLNTELKSLKKIKNQLMDDIVQNMEENNEESINSRREKKLEENKRLIDEVNEKMDDYEQELMELPKIIHDTNQELMLKSMDYCYDNLRINNQEAAEIAEWIKQVRIDLKKNIIRKQNRDINNREMYAYMHDILGPDVLDLFDMHYEEEPEESKDTKEETAKKE